MFYTEKYRKMRGRMPSENTEKAVSLFLHLFSHHRAHSYVYSLPVRGCTWQLSPSLRRSDRAIRCWYLFTAKRYAHLCQRGLCHDVRDHPRPTQDRKSTRLNSSHVAISYAVFCLKKKNTTTNIQS